MQDPVLQLTFDDGPDPTWTPAILSVLADAEATATFFVVTDAVRRAPAVLQQIQDSGHVVGLHGEQHLDHTRASAAELAVDTHRAITTLRALGVAPKLWRLPWGRSGPTTAELAAEHGLQIVGWDVDTHDWRGDDWVDQPDAVLRVASEGGIVLLHDGLGPGATRRDVLNTITIVTRLLSEAASHGTAVRAISEVADV